MRQSGGKGGGGKIGEAVRPLDIVLRPGERALVITGGNAGGKTVCLKTLGLIAAMALSGLPVHTVGKNPPLLSFSRVDAFIGDEQSLADNVSTFTAQIEHLAKAWKHLDASGLVLLDEFGAGTDPAQGAALAQAVLDGCWTNIPLFWQLRIFPRSKKLRLTREGARARVPCCLTRRQKPLFSWPTTRWGQSGPGCGARTRPGGQHHSPG